MTTPEERNAEAQRAVDAEKAAEIRKAGKAIDYEAQAIESIARSWELCDEPECAALALADAQVWASLHLARVTSNLRYRADEGGPR